jgi:ligand-binding sensor domain-containing protein
MRPCWWRSRRWYGIFATLLLLPAVATSLVIWKASHAREQASRDFAATRQFAFRLLPVNRPILSGIDLVAANPGFQDAALFDDHLVISARAGLFVYDTNGGLLHWYRADLELPSAELGAMSAGIAAGSARPELFIATHGAGVLAFDGSQFRQILPDDTELRSITALLALGSGRILIGTARKGLLVFDGRQLSPFPAQPRALRITALAGTDGDLWVGTLANGVFHVHSGQWDDLHAALPDPQVLSLSVELGRAFVGTPLGVVEFREGARARSLADGFFAKALAREQDDSLAIGTEDEGVAHVPLASNRIGHLSLSSDTSLISPVRLAMLGGDLYALADNALLRFDTAQRTWRSVLTASPPVLTDRNISALAVSSGRLWVGYFDRGLDLLPLDLEHATHQENDTLYCINRISADAAGARIAVATANGLAIFDQNAQLRQIMTSKDGLLSDQITDVAFRDSGMVIATPAGISFADRSGVRSLYAFHGLVNNHVYTVASWNRQTLAGTLGGISLLEDDAVRVNYTTANSHLKHNWITALVRAGDDWLAGTYGEGVLRLDRNGEWHTFPDLRAGFVVNPNAMLLENGRVYAGSLDRGLFILDLASGRWSNWTEGLPSRNVTALAADNGFLYVGTDNGLVRISAGVLR